MCTKGLNFSVMTDQSFPFENSLKSHRVSHHTLASFFCLHANCTKKFKNKGDLTRHVKEHDGVLHECPNCDYKNVDIRNLESHRIKHSKIEKYSCKLCEKQFNYNTQLRRHIRDKKCPKLRALRSISSSYNVYLTFILIKMY